MTNRPNDVDLTALAYIKAHGHEDIDTQAVLLADTDRGQNSSAPIEAELPLSSGRSDDLAPLPMDQPAPQRIEMAVRRCLDRQGPGLQDLVELCYALATVAGALVQALATQAGQDPDAFIDGMQANLVQWFGRGEAT